MLSFALRADGHEVIEAVDGVDGMAQFTKMRLVGATPDVIISDVYMPNGNGLTFVAGLRAIGCTSPIILVSASSTSDTRDRADALNVELLRKPLEIELLRHKVGLIC